MFTWQHHQLAHQLHFSLFSRKPCHGYQNACVCPECLKRAKQPKLAAPPPQPWEPRKAA